MICCCCCYALCGPKTNPNIFHTNRFTDMFKIHLLTNTTVFGARFTFMRTLKYDTHPNNPHFQAIPPSIRSWTSSTPLASLLPSSWSPAFSYPSSTWGSAASTVLWSNLGCMGRRGAKTAKPKIDKSTWCDHVWH